MNKSTAREFLLNAARKMENTYDEALEVYDPETGELVFDGSDLSAVEAVREFIEKNFGDKWDDGIAHNSSYIVNMYDVVDGEAVLCDWVDLILEKYLS